MENKQIVKSTIAGPAAPDPTPMTPEAFVEALRSLRQHVPSYQQLTVSERRAMGSTAHINEDFVRATIDASGASDIVRTAMGAAPDELRTETADTGSWSAVAEELKAILKGVESAILVRRYRTAIKALQVYGFSQQLVRLPEHADLLPHLDSMHRLNKFGRRRAVKKVTPATDPGQQSPAK